MKENIKKYILISIAVIAVGLLGVVLWWFMQFGTYTDKTYGFSIQYPSAWKLVQTPAEGVAAAFLSPKENAMDRFQENVNVSIEDVPAELATTKNFSDKVLEQMTKVFKNIKVTESKEVMFGQHRGYRAVFVTDTPDKVTILTVWTIKNGNRAYILTYMAMTRQYQTYLPLVETMIQSFKLK